MRRLFRRRDDRSMSYTAWQQGRARVLCREVVNACDSGIEHEALVELGRVLNDFPGVAPVLSNAPCGHVHVSFNLDGRELARLVANEVSNARARG